MIISYSLTYAAVTLRIWLPILLMIFSGDFNTAYRIVAWLSWVPNFIYGIYRFKKNLDV
jgi:hypothetical protein